MNNPFDKEIYRNIFQKTGGKHHPFKVTLYCSHRDEDARFFRANQIIKIALALSDGPFQILLGEYQDPKLDEKGDMFGHADYYPHNYLDIDRLLNRASKVDEVR